jgi:hypothetical protein
MTQLVGTVNEQQEERTADFWQNHFTDSLSKQDEQNQTINFWKNHSVFQLPARVVSFKGAAESLILLYCYKLANAVHSHCPEEVRIELTIREETLVEKTGLSRAAVTRAIRTLEVAECIKVIRKRDPATGRVRTSVYLLLHSTTKEPLRAFPKQFGVCHSNSESRPYLTVPQESREIINRMRPAGRAVYLSGLLVGSRSMRTSLHIVRSFWQETSLLGVNAFGRGLKECKKRALLSYKRGVLTLNDPVTGKPSERYKYECRIEHEKPEWRFDLDSVTAVQWQHVLEKILPGTALGGHNGWTRTSLHVLCPFCHEERTFAVNTRTGHYSCKSEKCSNHSNNGKGRLGQLVQRVLGLKKMSHVKAYLQKSITDMQEVTI